jgi:hypothetical protein
MLEVHFYPVLKSTGQIKSGMQLTEIKVHEFIILSALSYSQKVLNWFML